MDPIPPTPKPEPTGTLHLYLSTLQLHGDESTLSGVYDAFEALQQAVADAEGNWGGKAQIVVDPLPPPEPGSEPVDPDAPVPFQALADRIAGKPADDAGATSGSTSGVGSTGASSGDSSGSLSGTSSTGF